MTAWFWKGKGEGEGEDRPKKVNIAEGLWVKCDSCKEIVYRAEVDRAGRVCPKCRYPFRISARERIASIVDEGSFEERESGLTSKDPLGFKDTKRYTDRVKAARSKTGLEEAVLTGVGRIGGHPVALAVFEFAFLGGSMASVVGEKVTRAIELAIQKRLPLLIVSASGGDDEQRQALLDGQLDGPRDLLAHDRGHAAAEERELEDGEGHGMAADAPHAREHRFLEAGLAARSLDAIRVSLGVLEAEGILGGEPGLAFLEGAFVHDGGDALARADPEGIAALGADTPRPIDLGAVDDLLAGVALDPETFGDIDLLGPVLPFPFSLALPEPRGHALGHRPRPGEAERLLERGDEIAHPGHELRRAGMLLDELDDGRSHDDAVGDLAHRLGLGGRADAEADANGLGGDPAQGAQVLGQLRGQLGAGARHPGERHHVEEAAARPRDLAHALGGGGRRDQVNEVEPRRLGERAQRTRLLGRQVRHDDTVHPAFHRGETEGLEAEGEERVVVGEEDEGHGALPAQLARELEHARQGHAGRERPLRRALDDGPVGERIRERHAQLDDVGPASPGLQHELARVGERGVARREVRDEGALAPLPKRREGGGEASGGRQRRPPTPTVAAGLPRPFPDAKAVSTVCTSLSPRPDRPTTMLRLFGMAGALRNTQATA